MKRLSIIISILFISALVSNCRKPDPTPEPEPEPNPIVEISEIDEFIWEGLSTYYLWEDVAPYISNSSYSGEETRNNFISSYNEDHEALFYDLLYQYGTIDKWSWIVDDYVALENMFQGITKTMGFDYGLVRLSNSDDIFGYIRYVLPDSPASNAGLSRGDLFLEINDQQLTVNNYRDLLSLDSYKLSFATIENNVISANGKESTLMTAVELQENPVYISKVIDIDGLKVGYLMYNGFTSSFDNELNDAFADLKAQGVSELILDLRYNGGGSVQTAIYLASMIYGTNTDQVFSKSQWNAELQAYLTQEYGSDFFIDYFTDEISQDGGGSLPINSLELSRVHIIATGSSASASELVINGLMPYMDVYLVGTNTHGKYVGSITVKDYISNNTVNPNHTWAMQPIVLKIANSQGVSDYVDGFAPDTKIIEDLTNLSILGDEAEPLLSAALDHIIGRRPSGTKALEFEYFDVADSKDLKPLGKDMHMDITIDKKLQLH